jgi:hypothetical protein
VPRNMCGGFLLIWAEHRAANSVVASERTRNGTTGEVEWRVYCKVWS